VYGRAPEREWLPIYARRFSTVEVNATFYRLPSAHTVQGWADHSPDGFVFAVKVSRYVTHIKRLHDAGSHLKRLLERIDPLIAAGKLGPLLWQLPETFHRDDDRLASALDDLPRELRHAVEFRHDSWFCAPVMDILRRADVALVIGDHPERRFQTRELTADFTYVRFHHGSAGRGGNYSHRELAGWAKAIEGLLAQTDVYAYFNNDWLGPHSDEPFAVANARDLGSMLKGAAAAAPAA
jgi:uncharacterized protein YecE (DUF72 family)